MSLRILRWAQATLFKNSAARAHAEPNDATIGPPAHLEHAARRIGNRERSCEGANPTEMLIVERYGTGWLTGTADNSEVFIRTHDGSKFESSSSFQDPPPLLERIRYRRVAPDEFSLAQSKHPLPAELTVSLAPVRISGPWAS